MVWACRVNEAQPLVSFRVQAEPGHEDGSPGKARHRPRLSQERLTVKLNTMTDDFELLSEVTRIEVMAVNLSIRERKRLKAQFGGRRWRKLKGEGRVRFPNGEIRQA